MDQTNLCNFETGRDEYQLCGTILNLGQLLALQNVGKEFYEEHFCKTILNLGQWFRRRYYLKKFLLIALLARYYFKKFLFIASLAVLLDGA